MTDIRPYHHGDLRAALISRALEVVEECGFEAVSLRALAGELGVSRGAPYRHFPERDQLLAEVASVGFERLLSLTSETTRKSEDPVERLMDAGKLFWCFAVENPQLFRLMYDSGLFQRIEDFPHLARAQREIYDTVHSLVRHVHQAKQTTAETGKSVQAKVVAFWSTLYGFAKVSSTSMLQPYMTTELHEGELECEVLRTAIGLDLDAYPGRPQLEATAPRVRPGEKKNTSQTRGARQKRPPPPAD